MTAPLLVARNLTRLFMRGAASLAAVDRVSFQIGKGETLALAGPSGSGKSTVARLVMQLLRPDAGEIELDGQNLAALPASALRLTRKRFQMVFQDTASAFNPRATVASALDAPLRIHRILPAPKRRAAIADLLRQVGLDPGLASRAIHEISGGQRQRIAIARALATSPDLIVLDEALSAIDNSIRGDILRLLLNLQAERSLAYLFISHDLSLVRAIAHRVAIMDAGRIVEIGPARQIIDAPQSDIGRALVAAIPHLPNRTKR